jgi:hypothetical protein
MEAWRVQSLIKTLESLAADNRAQQRQFRHDTHMNGYFEGLAASKEQAARWLREALDTTASRKPAAA